MSEYIPITPFHPIWDGASIPAMHWHFHRRLYERYGIILAPTEFRRLWKEVVVRKENVFYVAERARVHKAFVGPRDKTIYIVATDETMISVLMPSHAKRKKRQREKALQRLNGVSS